MSNSKKFVFLANIISSLMAVIIGGPQIWESIIQPFIVTLNNPQINWNYSSNIIKLILVNLVLLLSWLIGWLLFPILSWIVFSKIDKKYKKKWRRVLLIVGVLSLLSAFINIYNIPIFIFKFIVGALLISSFYIGKETS
ncbi:MULTISPECIES: hypothetical protein [Lactococcus]|uniref:hypothetical protein n=1 Tax=Lactococcus TaxID=1357 RepID=UPI001CDB9D2B|nr:MULTISPECIES: hypothetical protein [Lactococcus]MCA2391291.1 hypothetical protein [Lactococcus sp. NH2-7C]MCI1072694.1 hypothetical protein [Lactococcus lactis]MCT1195591.1 hypothetical protein [Lactococcus lactis]WGV29575.1 hypothetical protein QJV49_08540 [Lactococcus sp. NH2-7C]